MPPSSGRSPTSTVATLKTDDGTTWSAGGACRWRSNGTRIAPGAGRRHPRGIGGPLHEGDRARRVADGRGEQLQAAAADPADEHVGRGRRAASDAREQHVADAHRPGVGHLPRLGRQRGVVAPLEVAAPSRPRRGPPPSRRGPRSRRRAAPRRRAASRPGPPAPARAAGWGRSPPRRARRRSGRRARPSRPGPRSVSRLVPAGPPPRATRSARWRASCSARAAAASTGRLARRAASAAGSATARLQLDQQLELLGGRTERRRPCRRARRRAPLPGRRAGSPTRRLRGRWWCSSRSRWPARGRGRGTGRRRRP